jgi:hypothetical protein
MTPFPDNRLTQSDPAPASPTPESASISAAEALVSAAASALDRINKALSSTTAEKREQLSAAATVRDAQQFIRNRMMFQDHTRQDERPDWAKPLPGAEYESDRPHYAGDDENLSSEELNRDEN